MADVGHATAGAATSGDGTVLCVGDSHVQGSVGSTWVKRLAASAALAAAGFGPVVNEGVNGHLASTVLRDLPGILARHGRPSAVVLLVGTNDVLAAKAGPTWLRFYRWCKGFSAEHPSAVQYGQDLRKVLDLVCASVPAACRVLVLTLPPLGGEELGSAMNTAVAEYSEVVRREVAERRQSSSPLPAPPVQVLDFYAASCARVQAAAAGSAARPPAQAEQPFASFPYQVATVAYCAAMRLLGYGWDDLSAHSGLSVLVPDLIHLNDTAGALAAGLVEAALLQQGGVRRSPAAA